MTGLVDLGLVDMSTWMFIEVRRLLSLVIIPKVKNPSSQTGTNGLIRSRTTIDMAGVFLSTDGKSSDGGYATSAFGCVVLFEPSGGE